MAQHSDFRADPWSRLAGTLASYLRIVYGTIASARAEIRRLNRLHRPIAGPVEDPVARARFGSAYAARDPALALWVHATLVDATMTVVDAWQERLDRGRRATYYGETRPIGHAFGIPDVLLPADLEAFEHYVETMLGDDGPVHPTPTARVLASVILHPPLRPLVERGPLASRLGGWRAPLATVAGRIPSPAYDWALLPGVALLPERQRAEYGFPWGRVERAGAAWVAACWRLGRSVMPVGLRTFPQALRADRRVAAGQSRLGNRAA